MTTKSIKKQPQPIPTGYYTIRGTIKILQSYHFDISYDGLSYYRKLGIIGEPVRFKGYMDKFYYFPDMWRYITTAKLLAGLLDMSLKYIKQYVRKLPKDIYFDLPQMVLKAHEEVWGIEQQRLLAWRTTMYDTLCIGMKKVLGNVVGRFDPTRPHQFYKELEKETRAYRGSIYQTIFQKTKSWPELPDNTKEPA